MDVNWRLFMAGASLFLGVGVNGYLLSVEDISGATIMGDGRVALILDVGSLVRRSRH